MNPKQLATLDEAKAIAQKVGPIGGGVKPQTEDPTTAGIYEITYPGGPYAAPSAGDAKFLFFRFSNGTEGYNVGLTRELINTFPTTWQPMLLAMVNS